VSELELELRELRVEWPETPDVAGAVASRLAAAPAPTRQRRLWRWRWRSDRPAWQVAVAAAAVLIAVVMAVPPARSAVLDLLGFGSVRITREEPRPSLFGQGLALGDPVTLEQARRRAGFPVLVPAEVGEPDAVYLATPPGAGTRVDLVYRARPGLPSSSNTGAGLLVTEFRAVASPVIEKAIGGGASVERLTVGGDPAFFISGAEHGFAYVDTGTDQVGFEQGRLAGNTLLVERSDGVLLRIEGEVSQEEAVAIAESAGARG
jgi:hypothetical protein